MHTIVQITYVCCSGAPGLLPRCVYRWCLQASDLRSSWRCARELSHSGVIRSAHAWPKWCAYRGREDKQLFTGLQIYMVLTSPSSYTRLVSPVLIEQSTQCAFLILACTLLMLPVSSGHGLILTSHALVLHRLTRNAHTKSTVQLRGKSSSSKWRNTTNSSSVVHSRIWVVSLNHAHSL